MNITHLYPTHKCFDDALDFLTEKVRKEPKIVFAEEWLLCHGVCRMPDGKLYSHAWVEQHRPEGVVCWFVALVGDDQGPSTRAEVAAERSEFYEHFGVTDDVTRYTLRQVNEQNKRHGTYGPWEDRYLVLCRDYRKETSDESQPKVRQQ